VNVSDERITRECAAAFIEKHRPTISFEPVEWPAEVTCRCGFTLRASSRNELTAFWVQHTVAALMTALVTPLVGAFHALRSYQYGNTATDLAKEIADEIEKVLAAVQIPTT
jgi:hypothetical protein